MKTIQHISLFFIISIFILQGCAAPPQAASDGRLKVVATIGQIANTAEVIGGDLVSVEGLMGAGVDPHLYVATESDVSSLQQADIIFYNGLHLEAQMAEILDQLGDRKTVVAAGESVDTARLIPWTDGGGQYDPHVWFDLTMWQTVAETIRDTYIEADPENAGVYRENAGAFIAELDTLHNYILDQAGTLPPEQRILVTAHDAFSYFGQAYGFEVRGLQGISTESEAGTGDVQDLAGFIVDNQIRAIFIESSVPIRNVEALQAAVAAQGWQVEIGGELFSDAMGDSGTPEGTYLGMVRHNIDTIIGALTSGQ